MWIKDEVYIFVGIEYLGFIVVIVVFVFVLLIVMGIFWVLIGKFSCI